MISHRQRSKYLTVAAPFAVTVAVLVALAVQGTAQQKPIRRLAQHHGRRRRHALLDARPDQRVELQQPEGRLGVARREGRRHQPRRRGQRARAADLRRRHAHHRLGSAADDRVARSGDRQDAVDVPGADDRPPRVLDALQPRQGRRVHAHQRARRRLHHHARVLPARARRQDRPAARELGRGRARSRASRRPARSIC